MADFHSNATFNTWRLSCSKFTETCKMQIIIEPAVEGEQIKEWGLLEFQGVFSTRDSEPIYEQFIGDLNFNKDGTPFFIVGHHILFGEEVKLEKPFAVLRKVVEGENQTKYLVDAVIRRKILFKTRPKPIICDLINKNE